MNKIISLFAVFCIAIALLGCGGGGGGGSPVAPPRPEFNAELRKDYPAVAGSYDRLASVLLDSSGALPEDRTNSFMKEIGSDFVGNSGSPAFDELKTTTASRLDRYAVNAYDFVPAEFTKIDEKTIKVSTYMYIDVVRKPGKEGAVPRYSDYVQPNPEIVWKEYDDKVWRIVSGLPYLSSDISF